IMTANLEIYQASLTNEPFRPTNEDVEIVKLNMRANGTPIDPEYSPVNIFMICDGHGGKKVAQAVAPYLAKKLCQKHLYYPLNNSIINGLYDNIQRKLEASKKQIANGCGTTALVVLHYSISHVKYVQIINIGDCRVVVSKDGVAMAWSKDHKPD